MPLTHFAESLRISVYRHFARDGAVPTRASLAEEHDVTEREVDRAFVELADNRHIVPYSPRGPRRDDLPRLCHTACVDGHETFSTLALPGTLSHSSQEADHPDSRSPG